MIARCFKSIPSRYCLFASLAIIHSPLLARGADQVLPAFEDLLLATDPDIDDTSRSLLFDNVFVGGNAHKENKEKKPEVGLGGVCGNNNPCVDGLDCTVTTGITWRICLPMTCLQRVMDEHNKPAREEGGPTIFEEFHHNVLTGAGISPTIIKDHMENDLLNDTTLSFGTGQALAGVPQFVLKDEVRNNLVMSLRQEKARDTLDMEALDEKARACFDAVGGADDDDGHGRNLQSSSMIASMPGFFLEFGAAAQLSYNLGIMTLNSTDITWHDVCIGGGPTAGASTGYLHQFWWADFASSAEEALETNGIEIDPQQTDTVGGFLPWPAFMVELDGAAGVGFGIAYNTLGGGCHRLFLRGMVGGGAGLALSACFVALCGEFSF